MTGTGLELRRDGAGNFWIIILDRAGQPLAQVNLDAAQRQTLSEELLRP